jgi:hypothetical protein
MSRIEGERSRQIRIALDNLNQCFTREQLELYSGVLSAEGENRKQRPSVRSGLRDLAATVATKAETAPSLVELIGKASARKVLGTEAPEDPAPRKAGLGVDQEEVKTGYDQNVVVPGVTDIPRKAVAAVDLKESPAARTRRLIKDRMSISPAKLDEMARVREIVQELLDAYCDLTVEDEYYPFPSPAHCSGDPDLFQVYAPKEYDKKVAFLGSGSFYLGEDGVGCVLEPNFSVDEQAIGRSDKRLVSTPEGRLYAVRGHSHIALGGDKVSVSHSETRTIKAFWIEKDVLVRYWVHNRTAGEDETECAWYGMIDYEKEELIQLTSQRYRALR